MQRALSGNSDRIDGKRLIMEFIQLVLSGTHVSYSRHKENYRTDAISGRPEQLEPRTIKCFNVNVGRLKYRAERCARFGAQTEITYRHSR